MGSRSERPPWRWLMVVTLLAWGATIVLGGSALDDAEVLGSPVVRGVVPWYEAFLRDYWFHESSAGHWRPLPLLSLRLDHTLWGGAWAGYHLTNVLLHLACVLGAAAVVARLVPGAFAQARHGAWTAGLTLFALHPALADSVAWVSGRSSMLSALGGLLLVAGALSRGPLLVTFACAELGAFAGLASKEDAIVFLPLAIGLAFRSGRRRGLALLGGLTLALAGAGLLRRVALGQVLPHAVHAELAQAALLERLELGGRALIELLHALVWPLHLPPTIAIERLGSPPPPGWAGLLMIALCLLAGAGSGVLALRSLRRGAPPLLSGSLFLVLLALAPHSQLIPSGELFGPRFLYLPLLLGVPLTAALAGSAARALPARRTLGLLATGAAVLLAWSASSTYSSRASFWRAVLAHDAEDARAWNALGNAHRESGAVAAARAAYERSSSLRPGYSRPLVNLGTLALEAGDDFEAERLLTGAVRQGPENPKAWSNLGVLYLRNEEWALARAAFSRATILAPGSVPAWRGLGLALEGAGDPAAARGALGRARLLDPGDARTSAALGRLGPEPAEREQDHDE